MHAHSHKPAKQDIVDMLIQNGGDPNQVYLYSAIARVMKDPCITDPKHALVSLPRLKMTSDTILVATTCSHCCHTSPLTRSIFHVPLQNKPSKTISCLPQTDESITAPRKNMYARAHARTHCHLTSHLTASQNLDIHFVIASSFRICSQQYIQSKVGYRN